MKLPSWCYTLHEDVYEWLMQLQVTQHPGCFKLSREGNIFSPSAFSGLDASALALKIVYMIGALDRVPPANLNSWVEFIQSFQQQEAVGGFLNHQKYLGFFIDPLFIKQADSLFISDTKTRRDVTRQACAALMSAGSTPKFPVRSIPHSICWIMVYGKTFVKPKGEWCHENSYSLFYS